MIMCAESMWCRCHRRIIADYFIAADEKVFNLLGPNHVEATRITDGAKFERLGSLIYLLTDDPDQTKNVHITAN